MFLFLCSHRVILIPLALNFVNCLSKVGADGFNSQVRRNSDINCVSYDYKQSGVVATLCFSEVNVRKFLGTYNTQ